MEDLNKKYEKHRVMPNIFFENVKEDTPAFYNNNGLGIGFVKLGKDTHTIYNTSFNLGGVSQSEKEGNVIWYGRGALLKKAGFITEDGNVYYDKEGAVLDIFKDGRLKKTKVKQAETIKIGRVEATGSGNNAVAVAYDLSGAKVGEVRNGGESAALYAGGMLALVINYDEKNAPYSKSYCGFFTPAPPAAAPDARRDTPSVPAPRKQESGLKKFFKFLSS
ncbi:MAG: hypothetical protein FWH08_02915 [Oscillospiraceae bacterium]|nr:hypothetical protein [Oscillospiraceae bacterium]